MSATLGDVCTFLNGGTPSKSVSRYFEGNIPWITGADIVGPTVELARSFITEEAIQNSATNRVPAGTVLLVTRTSVGKVAVTGTTLCFSQDITALTPDAQKLDIGYLVQFLRTKEPHFERLARGATIKGIARDVVADLRVPLPPLAEQKRVAEILDRAEALRAKRRATLAQFDTLTQAIFLDLFGDPVTNPSRWPTVEFAQICERITVGIVVRPASYYVPKGVPALRSLNIKPGHISLEELVYFSKMDNETKLAKTKLKAGDLLLVRSGQPGTAAVVPPELDGVNAIDLLIATPIREAGDSVFLCHFFNSAGGGRLVLTSQRGQVQKHLNVGSLNVATLPLPPIRLQREFARRVAAVEKLKTAHRASLAELDALFAALQHRAFRGEL